MMRASFGFPVEFNLIQGSSQSSCQISCQIACRRLNRLDPHVIQVQHYAEVVSPSA